MICALKISVERRGGAGVIGRGRAPQPAHRHPECLAEPRHLRTDRPHPDDQHVGPFEIPVLESLPRVALLRVSVCEQMPGVREDVEHHGVGDGLG
jgi:hypothetical protein